MMQRRPAGTQCGTREAGVVALSTDDALGTTPALVAAVLEELQASP